MHQCYYCGQLFDTKEKLYEHVEVHSDVERNNELMSNKKRQDESNADDGQHQSFD